LTLDIWTIVLIAGPASLAAIAGALLTKLIRPTTFFLSLALGFAGGILIGAVTFEMLPEAIELGSLAIGAAGFAVGFTGIYGLDLLIHRGKLAGEGAAQRERVEQQYRERRPFGDEVTVLAGGISIEDIVQGISIGIGAGIEPGLALVIAIAVGIDALTEGISIGELVLSEHEAPEGGFGRVLKWCLVIAASIFFSAVLGWFALRGMPDSVLAFLFALGGGAMLYLAVTQLVPTAQKYHYQGSSALVVAAGFLVILALGHVV
jgi:zinc transporter, ZIP family